MQSLQIKAALYNRVVGAGRRRVSSQRRHRWTVFALRRSMEGQRVCVQISAAPQAIDPPSCPLGYVLIIISRKRFERGFVAIEQTGHTASGYAAVDLTECPLRS